MDLSERIKQYENVSKTRLMRKTPVIIRIDGKAFHTFTRGLSRPFDKILRDALDGTMKYLCENIQGCVLGYAQSDEITLVLQDWAKFETDAWFDYEVQKMCSVSSSMATMAFNKYFQKNVEEFCKYNEYEFKRIEALKQVNKSFAKYLSALMDCCEAGAMFDARCFNIPFSEVTNMLIWRQQDATRNSIQSLAQTMYSQKELEGISNNDLQNKMFSEKGVNWNKYPVNLKRGCCCIKTEEGWKIDKEIPIFTSDRAYIENKMPALP